MIKFDVQYDPKILQIAAKKYPIAAMAALNKAAESAVTFASAEVRKTWNIRKSELDAAFTVSRAASGRLHATIRVKGKTLSPMAFGLPTISSAGIVVNERIGQAREIKHAFLATMPSGHTGIFLRRSKARRETRISKTGKRRSTQLPIIERTGPSIPILIGSPAMFAKISQFIKQQVPLLFKHEIDWRKEAGKSL